MSDLSEVKAGDEIAIIDGHGNNIRICTVERRTKTMIFAGNRKFRLNGLVIGGGKWSAVYARIPYPDDFEKILRQQIYAKLERTKWDECSTETLLSVAKLLANEKGEP